MESFNPYEGKKFSSSEEELSFLREQIAKKEREFTANKKRQPQEAIAKEVFKEYKRQKPEVVLAEDRRLEEKEAKAIVLKLSPEKHDNQMAELLAILQEKGVMNALSVASRMNNPHIEDDFERFLVQYVKEGYLLVGAKEKSPLFKALRMTLYEIALPERGKDEPQKNLKELISSMEQFYAGMLSVSGDGRPDPSYFSLEIAAENHSDDFVFYAAVPDSKKDLFEKQILSVFYDAKISEKKDDYNIFNENGAFAGSCASFSNKPIFSLKTYDKFDYDPLNIILNSFSKIDKDGEGASIQIIFKPAGDSYVKKYKQALEKISKGTPIKEAIDFPEGGLGQFIKFAKDFIGGGKKGGKEKEQAKKEENLKTNESAIENIKEKISSPVVEANIRIMASSHNQTVAEEILADLESAFNQFENTLGNKLKFHRLKGRSLKQMAKDFSFRLFSDNHKLPMSVKELTTIAHLPSTGIKSAPQLKISKTGSAPAPAGLLQSGILLGINRFRNTETKVYMASEDRLRHFYCIGQTGTGKTTLLKNMIAQDILAGDGACFIDPHGSDIKDILAIVPKERYDDVIYFDPGYAARPMGLNMLEFDRNYPEQKTFVVNEMLSIFNKLFDMRAAGGPMFEQYFRNSVLLVMEDPDSGNTLIDVSRVLADKKFRDAKLSKCKNPIVSQFWKEVAEKAGGEAALANMVPYITSKFDAFLSNEIMRPIIGQEKSAFNFRDIMDKKKILLVNLSKGRLGDINSHLIGLVIVGKILMAALSRADSIDKETPPFYLYIDEFQNITTDSIVAILSEARKYKLSLNIAHQFIKQIDEKIKDAVFGNVGTVASFRIGSEDAEYLGKQFEPVFAVGDLINLDNRNAFVKLLSGGRPMKPFNMETLPPPKGDEDQMENLKQLSYMKYGQERALIDEEIMQRYGRRA